MNEARARVVYAYVKAHPGRRANQIARALDMPYSTVCNALVATERFGLYLYEEKGKLYVSEELRTPSRPSR